MTLPPRSGRPRASSAQVLADAAEELFLEQGYGRTTVDQIAARAGVSRATFFNYFASKSDVMWLELDAAVRDLGALLGASGGGSVGSEGASGAAGAAGAFGASDAESPVRAVEAALLAAARNHDPDRVPWAIAQAEVMQIGESLVESVAARIMAQHSVVAAYVASRTGEYPGSLWPQTVAGAMLGAAAAAFSVWVNDGVQRGPLVEYVGAALTPVAAGLDAR